MQKQLPSIRSLRVSEANPDLKIPFDTSTLRGEVLTSAYAAYIRFGNGFWPGCVADYLCGRQQIMVARPKFRCRQQATVGKLKSASAICSDCGIHPAGMDPSGIDRHIRTGGRRNHRLS
jgi:hypothetical protein